MLELIFATNNANKVKEIRQKLPEGLQVISLDEAGIDIDIPEPFETLEENAAEKARVIHGLTGKNCFSEDTGLEVPALGGQPGVRSARYAGDHCSTADNIEKLLAQMALKQNRQARFRTVICLHLQGKEYLFEGICEGTILEAPKGAGGFGYDPVFAPLGSARSFGEMDLTEKAAYSHRSRAVAAMAQFLRELLTREN